jgi:hypothetical protein
MQRFTRYGGLVASVILIAFGIGATVMGVAGRDTVRDNLAAEKIVGTPDMTKIAGQTVNTGGEAREFAKVMREHALEATGGKTYAEMPRFLGKDGNPTSDEKAAAVNPKSGAPLDNPARNIWVTETALSTALNTAYFAEQVALFSIVMGIALLLTGVGFLVLTLRLLSRPEKEASTVPAVRRGAVAAGL